MKRWNESCSGLFYMTQSPMVSWECQQAEKGTGIFTGYLHFWGKRALHLLYPQPSTELLDPWCCGCPEYLAAFLYQFRQKKKKEKSLDLLPSLSFLTYLQRITALKTHVLQKGRQQLTAFEIRAALSYASLRNTCRFEGLCRIYTAEPCLQDHHCEKKKNNGQEFPGNSSLWWLADIVLNYRLWSPDLQPEFQLQC